MHRREIMDSRLFLAAYHHAIGSIHPVDTRSRAAKSRSRVLGIGQHCTMHLLPSCSWPGTAVARSQCLQTNSSPQQFRSRRLHGTQCRPQWSMYHRDSHGSCSRPQHRKYREPMMTHSPAPLLAAPTPESGWLQRLRASFEGLDQSVGGHATNRGDVAGKLHGLLCAAERRTKKAWRELGWKFCPLFNINNNITVVFIVRQWREGSPTSLTGGHPEGRPLTASARETRV